VSYLEVQITTSAQQLADLAVEKLKEELEARGVVGWEPNDSDLEIIQIGAISLMASYAANVAAVVPPAIFRKYGTELLGVAYNEGANATCNTKWTLLEEGGEYPARIIEAGTQLTIGELAFYVESEVKVAKGESSATVQLVAAERGTEYNGLKETIQLVDAIDWVSEVKIVGESSGGVDQETDEEYQSRLAAELVLQAPRPITAANFAEMALVAPSSLLPTGVEISRATAIDGYNPETKTSENERTVCVFVKIRNDTPTAETETHAVEARKAIKEYLEGFRELNFVVFVEPPTYTKVYVTTKVKVLPNYSTVSVEANVKAAIVSYLSAETWGNPEAATTGANSWLNATQGYGIVRYNQIIGLIERTQGVAYVFAGSEGLKTGTSASPSGTADITLTGEAPLPETENSYVLVTAE
jgi:hypothetical protein